MKQAVVAGLVALGVMGCAKSADKVAASYVSPLTYNQYDCSQINMEAQRVSSRAQELTGAQNNKATGDAVATTVSLIVFWPALFFIGGDDHTTAELARLKGEMEAIERASIEKKCGIVFERPKKPDEA